MLRDRIDQRVCSLSELFALVWGWLVQRRGRMCKLSIRMRNVLLVVTLRLLLSLDKEDVNETLHVRYPDHKSIEFPTFCALVSAQHRVGWHMRQIDGRTSSVTLRLASGGIFHYEEKQAGKVRRQEPLRRKQRIFDLPSKHSSKHFPWSLAQAAASENFNGSRNSRNRYE